MHNKLTSVVLILLLSWCLPALAQDENAAQAQAVYYQIEEPFTINFLHQSEQKVRYLQIKVALMAHDPQLIDNAKLNLPMIQDALRSLFSEQSYETVSSIDGRKQLQQEALSRIQTLLKQETGSPGPDQVYFTSFILQ